MSELISIGIFVSTLRVGVPLCLAALGGILTYRAGIIDISIEGKMLMGAFFAIVVGQYTGNIWLALISAALAGILLSLIFGFMVISVKANEIVSAIASNLFAAGITGYLLYIFFGVTGSFKPDKIFRIPSLNIEALEVLPVIELLNNQSILLYVSFFVIIILWIYLYKIPSGYYVRALAENPEGVRTVGVKVKKIQYITLIWSGVLCGLAGASLSTGILSVFTEEMIAGRGYMVFTAIVFGRGEPLFVFLAALFFAFADSFAIRSQMMGLPLPIQAIQSTPYISTVIAIALASKLNKKSY